MSCLQYHGNELFIENVSLEAIASQFGTPCYIYSRLAIESNWRTFDEALKDIPHRICYAVKANSNIAILSLLAKLNSSFDIVSIGELERVIAAGGKANNVVFSGVGKSYNEIEQAIIKGVYCFDVESEPEIDRLQIVAAKLNKKINIALRVNPDVDPRTHAHISTGLKENKFGIEHSQVIPLSKKITALSHLQLMGIACHIGSQIMDLEPFKLAAESMLAIYKELKNIGITIQHINIGGGLGITYQTEKPPAVVDYVHIIKDTFAAYPIHIIIEPGRSIVGNAGALLTRIEYLKHTSHRNFAIVDAGMNDLIRSALYEAWHNILPVQIKPIEKQLYDIVGPVCESADFLGKHRSLAIMPNDLLAIDSAGAYGFSMSSNYNSRCRPAEVLIDGDKIHLIRRRETLADSIALEQIIKE